MRKIFIYPAMWCMLTMCGPWVQAQHKATSHEEKMHDMSASLEQTDTITLAVLVFPGMVLQDLAGPVEVFSKAQNLTRGKYRTLIVGLTDDPVPTENELITIIPQYTLETVPPADYLIIPGGSMPVINNLMQDATLIAFIRAWNQRPNTKTASICTGAYLLAQSGALQHQKATTHFFVADDFQEQFPDITLVKNVRYIDGGKYLTSSGVTSGIDLALHLVEQHTGKRIADMIARALQYTPHQQEPWPVAPHGMRYRRTP